MGCPASLHEDIYIMFSVLLNMLALLVHSSINHAFFISLQTFVYILVWICFIINTWFILWLLFFLRFAFLQGLRSPDAYNTG